MSPFVKTWVSEVLLLAALAAPILIGGCERQSEPPVEPRAGRQGTGAHTGPLPPPSRDGIAMDDAAITARVKTALMADEQVKGLAIDVDTKSAKVILKGALEREEQVKRAIEVARQVEGVRDVVNRLTVTGEHKTTRNTPG